MVVESGGVMAKRFQAFVHAELAAAEERILTEYARQLPVGFQSVGLRSAATPDDYFPAQSATACGPSPPPLEKASPPVEKAPFLAEDPINPHCPGLQDEVRSSEAGQTPTNGMPDELHSEQGGQEEDDCRARLQAKLHSRRSKGRISHHSADDVEELAERDKRTKAEKPVMQSNLFGDLAAMKEEAKLKYDVKEFYKKQGMWQWIARHSLFENITLGVIAFNALWMAIDCDNNSADSLLEAEIQFQIAEQFFCFYFVGELVTRFQAFQRKRNCMRDGWFVFDSILVTMMVMETWLMTIVMLLVGAGSGSSPLGSVGVMKLFRLARLSRLLRLLRSMPELLILVKGMVAAMRSVGFVMLLLLLITYVFSIAFIQLLRGVPAGDKYFPWMGDAMYTLIVAGTLMDNITTVANEIGADSFVCAVLFFVFVCLSALTVMNMLIGVLCEVVSTVATCEKEVMLITYVTARFKEIWESIDSDGGGTLSKSEFEKIISNRDALDALEEVDVDPMGLVKMVDLIFEDEETGQPKDMTFDEFMDIVLSFRGSNTATVKDISDMRRFLDNANQKRSEKLIGEVKDFMKTMFGGRGINDRSRST